MRFWSHAISSTFRPHRSLRTPQWWQRKANPTLISKYPDVCYEWENLWWSLTEELREGRLPWATTSVSGFAMDAINKKQHAVPASRCQRSKQTIPPSPLYKLDRIQIDRNGCASLKWEQSGKEKQTRKYENPVFLLNDPAFRPVFLRLTMDTCFGLLISPPSAQFPNGRSSKSSGFAKRNHCLCGMVVSQLHAISMTGAARSRILFSHHKLLFDDRRRKVTEEWRRWCSRGERAIAML